MIVLLSLGQFDSSSLDKYRLRAMAGVPQEGEVNDINDNNII